MPTTASTPAWTPAWTPDPRRVELVEALLSYAISTLGYPVGMGIAPHPETLRQLAKYAVTVAAKPDPSP